MRRLSRALFIAALLWSAGATHIGDGDYRCDGGWCRDGREYIMDCRDGTCIGETNAGKFPTIVNPVFGDGSWIKDSDRVVGVEIAGDARAYPVRVMNWFETRYEILTGRATDASEQLTKVPGRTTFENRWSNFYPDSRV